MRAKRIPRKMTDVFHILLFVVLLLLFANYESNRKNTVQEALSPTGNDNLLHLSSPARVSVTTWK